MIDDEIKRLKDALRANTPAPDPDARARAIALAKENFAARQGSAMQTRPTGEGTENPRLFLAGVKNMFAKMSLRSALMTTSGLAVVGLGVLIILPSDELTPDIDLGRPATVTEPVPLALDGQERQEQANAGAKKFKPGPAPEAEIAVQSDAIRSQAVNAPVASSPEALDFVGDDAVNPRRIDNERFANDDENPLNITIENPVSTFSIDVDTASYAFVRRALNDGALPNPDAVRVEEMVNYFPYDYTPPTSDTVPFSTNVSVFQTPWNSGTRLVHIAIQGEKPNSDKRPPLDLVFLIDTSGSMQDPDKLPLLKQSFRLLLSRLNADDRISIVTYAGSAGVVLDPTAAGERETILASLNRLEAGGSTAGQEGLQQAYGIAEKMSGDGRIGRIVLATDGDFNVGISDPEALKTYIADKRDSGVYLSVLGFGRGNYNDAMMQSLAQNGNGTAAYIDTLAEAQKTLVDQVSGALFPIANDVKIQVEFNPALIGEYRLIGYETRALAREDFNNDKVDAGDIGAGHSVTAIYEVTPAGSPAIKSDPLRYQSAPDTTSDTNEAGFVKLRYKEPGDDTSRLLTTPFQLDDAAPSGDSAFATAIAGFGQLLRSGKYLGDWSYSDAIALAAANKGNDAFGYRAQAVTLMRLADSLSR